MRPLTLSLQAFGSYADELVVDFRRLGRHGTFAITGPTGAGKSTIFDAIVYALYDDLPGFRIDGNVRSQYADPALLTRVTLQFEVHGTSWCIERTPNQTAPRLRGPGGPRTHNGTVLLRPAGADSGGLNRKREVADKVLELVGLTKEQFEQVVLIPQGKFEEVLKAETKDRAKLLRRLFPTDVFTATTERLKEVAGERGRSFELASAGQVALLEEVDSALRVVVGRLPEGIEHGLARTLEVAVSVDALPQVVDEVDRLAGVLAQGVASAKAESEAAAAALAAIVERARRWEVWQVARTEAEGFAAEESADRDLRAAVEQARDVATLAPSLHAWEQSSAVLAQLGPVDAADRGRLAAVLGPDRSADLDDPTTAANLGQRLGAEADGLAVAAKAYEVLEAHRLELETVGAALGERARLHEAARESLKVRDGALAALRGRIAALAAVAEGLEAARHRVTLARDALDHADAVARQAGEVDDLTAAVAEAQRAEGEARVAFEETFGSWRSGQAGRLAEKLADGAPCPTCGSTEHPFPAPRVVGTPTDAELSSAGDRRDDATSARSELEGRLKAARAELAALGVAGDVRKLSADCCDAEAAVTSIERAAAEKAVAEGHAAREAGELAEAKEAFAEEDRGLAADLATVAGEEKRWAADRDAFAGTHGAYEPMGGRAAALAEVAGAVKELAVVARRLADATSTRDQALGLLAPKMAELGLDQPAQLRARTMSEEDVVLALKELEVRHDRRAEARRIITAYEDEGGPASRPDPAPFVERRDLADERHSDLVGRHAVLQAEAAKVRSAPTRMASQAEAIEAARLAFEEADALADLCAGQGSGPVTARLSLENWVLADYLRRVLRQANSRLAVMTHGRYALELAEGATDGRKQFGLDLAVFDVNTGQSRPATTLSGGETFMAALSLALGLADVVSGGSNREMGALFVDEGFGSLDPGSLDAVIDVLRSLEDGGRIVGVVSHVEELKLALPSGITIEATSHGSRAEVHYPEI